MILRDHGWVDVAARPRQTEAGAGRETESECGFPPRRDSGPHSENPVSQDLSCQGALFQRSDDWARELFSLFPPDPVGSGCQRTPDRRSHIAPTDLQATLLGLTRAAIPPSGIYRRFRPLLWRSPKHRFSWCLKLYHYRSASICLFVRGGEPLSENPVSQDLGKLRPSARLCRFETRRNNQTLTTAKWPCS